jgi:hypothetical protein
MTATSAGLAAVPRRELAAAWTAGVFMTLGAIQIVATAFIVLYVPGTRTSPARSMPRASPGVRRGPAPGFPRGDRMASDAPEGTT